MRQDATRAGSIIYSMYKFRFESHCLILQRHTGHTCPRLHCFPTPCGFCRRVIRRAAGTVTLPLAAYHSPQVSFAHCLSSGDVLIEGGRCQALPFLSRPVRAGCIVIDWCQEVESNHRSLKFLHSNTFADYLLPCSVVQLFLACKMRLAALSTI